MDDLRPLRVFLAVAEQSSFAGAARTLGMTPATVTRAVARLEDDLGQQLLLRTTRQVSLTAAGAVAAARFRPLVEEFDQATSEAQRQSRPDRGRLRLNAPVSLGLKLLPGLLDSFRLAYPLVELEVSMTDRLIDVIAEDTDLAIRISGPPTDKSTIWRKICQVPRHVVAAPSLLARLDPPAHPDTLPRDLCLSYGSGPLPETWEFARGADRVSRRAGTAVITNNGDLLAAMARHGGGLVVLPDFIVADDLASGALVQLLPDWTVTPLWLTLYYPPYEQFPPLVARFTEFFEAYLRDAPEGAFVWA